MTTIARNALTKLGETLSAIAKFAYSDYSQDMLKYRMNRIFNRFVKIDR